MTTPLRICSRWGHGARLSGLAVSCCGHRTRHCAGQQRDHGTRVGNVPGVSRLAVADLPFMPNPFRGSRCSALC